MKVPAALRAHVPAPAGKTTLTVARCYWPAAHSLLRDTKTTYSALATAEGMRLTCTPEQAELLRQGLPPGACRE